MFESLLKAKVSNVIDTFGNNFDWEDRAVTCLLTGRTEDGNKYGAQTEKWTNTDKFDIM